MPASRSGAPTVTDAKGLKRGARGARRRCAMGATGRRPATSKPGRKREAGTGAGCRPSVNSSGCRVWGKGCARATNHTQRGRGRAGEVGGGGTRRASARRSAAVRWAPAARGGGRRATKKRHGWRGVVVQGAPARVPRPSSTSPPSAVSATQLSHCPRRPGTPLPARYCPQRPLEPAVPASSHPLHATPPKTSSLRTYLEAPPLEALARLPPARADPVHRRATAVVELASPRRPRGRERPRLAHPPPHPHPCAVVVVPILAVVIANVPAVPHKPEHVLAVGEVRRDAEAPPVRGAPPVLRAVAPVLGRAGRAAELPRRPAGVVEGRAGVVDLGRGRPEGDERPPHKAAVVVVAAIADVQPRASGGGGDGRVGEQVLPGAGAAAGIPGNGILRGGRGVERWRQGRGETDE